MPSSSHHSIPTSLSPLSPFSIDLLTHLANIKARRPAPEPPLYVQRSWDDLSLAAKWLLFDFLTNRVDLLDACRGLNLTLNQVLEFNTMYNQEMCALQTYIILHRYLGVDELDLRRGPLEQSAAAENYIPWRLENVRIQAADIGSAEVYVYTLPSFQRDRARGIKPDFSSWKDDALAFVPLVKMEALQDPRSGFLRDAISGGMVCNFDRMHRDALDFLEWYFGLSANQAVEDRTELEAVELQGGAFVLDSHGGAAEAQGLDDDQNKASGKEKNVNGGDAPAAANLEHPSETWRTTCPAVAGLRQSCPNLQGQTEQENRSYLDAERKLLEILQPVLELGQSFDIPGMAQDIVYILRGGRYGIVSQVSPQWLDYIEKLVTVVVSMWSTPTHLSNATTGPTAGTNSDIVGSRDSSIALDDSDDPKRRKDADVRKLQNDLKNIIARNTTSSLGKTGCQTFGQDYSPDEGYSSFQNYMDSRMAHGAHPTPAGPVNGAKGPLESLTVGDMVARIEAISGSRPRPGSNQKNSASRLPRLTFERVFGNVPSTAPSKVPQQTVAKRSRGKQKDKNPRPAALDKTAVEPIPATPARHGKEGQVETNGGSQRRKRQTKAAVCDVNINDHEAVIESDDDFHAIKVPIGEPNDDVWDPDSQDASKTSASKKSKKTKIVAALTPSKRKQTRASSPAKKRQKVSVAKKPGVKRMGGMTEPSVTKSINPGSNAPDKKTQGPRFMPPSLSDRQHSASRSVAPKEAASQPEATFVASKAPRFMPPKLVAPVNTPPSAATTTQGATVQMQVPVVQQSQGSQSPPKRKRGRPRKQPLVTSPKSQDSRPENLPKVVAGTTVPLPPAVQPAAFKQSFVPQASVIQEVYGVGNTVALNAYQNASAARLPRPPSAAPPKQPLVFQAYSKHMGRPQVPFAGQDAFLANAVQSSLVMEGNIGHLASEMPSPVSTKAAVDLDSAAQEDPYFINLLRIATANTQNRTIRDSGAHGVATPALALEANAAQNAQTAEPMIKQLHEPTAGHHQSQHNTAILRASPEAGLNPVTGSDSQQQTTSESQYSTAVFSPVEQDTQSPQ